jgi:hypothetical protein
MATQELLGFEELRERLSQLNKAKRLAQKEPEDLGERKERIAGLERNRDALLESSARMAPDGMDLLTSKERHQVYKMLSSKSTQRRMRRPRRR